MDTPVQLATGVGSDDAPTSAEVGVVRDPEVWSTLWGRALGGARDGAPLPAVDFGSSQVVVVRAGGGPANTLRITAVDVSRDQLVVTATRAEPGTGTMQAQVYLGHYAAVVSPRTDDTLQLDVRLLPVVSSG